MLTLFQQTALIVEKFIHVNITFESNEFFFQNYDVIMTSFFQKIAILKLHGCAIHQIKGLFKTKFLVKKYFQSFDRMTS